MEKDEQNDWLLTLVKKMENPSPVMGAVLLLIMLLVVGVAFSIPLIFPDMFAGL